MKSCEGNCVECKERDADLILEERKLCSCGNEIKEDRYDEEFCEECK